MLLLPIALALNPVRIGLTLLFVSRPRPLQNLLACWIGCMISSLIRAWWFR